MSNPPFFVVELKVKPGQIDDLRNVMREMVNITRTDESGTLNYDWFLSQDGTCYIYERYADEAAVLKHSATFPEALSKRGQAFLPTRLTVFGKVTDAIRERRIEPLRKAAPGIDVVFLDFLGGFSERKTEGRP